MIAFVESAAGKTIWKSPEVDVLSEPKSRITTESVVLLPPPVVVLYNSAPRAVMVADVNVMSSKSVSAVVPEVVGVTLVNVPPPAEYEPEELTSFVAV